MEDAIKTLVEKRGPFYVRYFFDQNQSEFEKKWHIGSFTYEYGVVKSPELMDAFRAGKVGQDQVQGECVNFMVINPLDKRFSSVSDATYLYISGDVAITRITKKNIENDAKKKACSLKKKSINYQKCCLYNTSCNGLSANSGYSCFNNNFG